MSKIEFTLPWPPTVNHYWARGRGGRMFIGDRGRSFRSNVAIYLMRKHSPTLSGRLSIVIKAYPPDRRKRDIDNIYKALLDALQHGGLYGDDNQIDHLEITRCKVEKPGRVELIITERK